MLKLKRFEGKTKAKPPSTLKKFVFNVFPRVQMSQRLINFEGSCQYPNCDVIRAWAHMYRGRKLRIARGSDFNFPTKLPGFFYYRLVKKMFLFQSPSRCFRQGGTPLPPRRPRAPHTPRP